MRAIEIETLEKSTFTFRCIAAAAALAVVFAAAGCESAKRTGTELEPEPVPTSAPKAVSLPKPKKGTRAKAADTQRPNVLVIITDQQFSDVMSCVMGREYIHTPHMDAL